MKRHATYLVGAALLLLGFPCSPAEAITRVFVQNNTGHTLSVRATQSGYSLAGNKWGQTASTVTPGQRAQVVWFNRDEGITNGENFYFTTALSAPTSSISLKQRLRGSLVNSHMWQSLEGPGISHPWYDDRSTHTATWPLGTSVIHIKYRAFFTGTDDNVEYILAESYTVAPGGPDTLNVLAYNIYMRPITLFKNGQMIRAGLLPGKLHGYDAIIFSEAFDDDARARLLSGLRAEYPYATRILGTDRGVEQDGGVIIVSRWPIEAQDQRLFRDVCLSDDCKADKGVLYARINKEGRRYHLFGSHTQAWPTAQSAGVRRRQFEIIKTFFDSKAIPASEAVMIGGDLNVDKTRFPAEFQEMLRILNATHPRQVGHPYSYDPRTNRLAEQGAQSEYLDYVLYSNAHRRPANSFNEVRMFRSSEEWKEYFWEYALWDLSDHYAMYGRFEFAAGPPPPSGPGPVSRAEDCLTYNPADLRIVDEGASGWLLTDGRSRMLTLDTRQDALDALALARRHTKHCFIGRGNARANRSSYIVAYWE
jgi:sphingomyelin phosphodiesterase